MVFHSLSQFFMLVNALRTRWNVHWKIYKIGIGHKKLFFPKIGPSLVYTDGNEAIYGITTDLAFEFNHLVIGVFGCATTEDEGNCIFATIGYKF